MNSLTVYDVEERVPVHGERIWTFHPMGLREGIVNYPYKTDKDQYKEDYYYNSIFHPSGHQLLKGRFSRYLLSDEVTKMCKKIKHHDDGTAENNT